MNTQSNTQLNTQLNVLSPTRFEVWRTLCVWLEARPFARVHELRDIPAELRFSNWSLHRQTPMPVGNFGTATQVAHLVQGLTDARIG